MIQASVNHKTLHSIQTSPEKWGLVAPATSEQCEKILGFTLDYFTATEIKGTAHGFDNIENWPTAVYNLHKFVAFKEQEKKFLANKIQR